MRVRIAQPARLMRTRTLLRRVLAAQLGLQQQEDMRENATCARLVSMHQHLRLSVATALREQRIMTCSPVLHAQLVWQDCMRQVGTLASATAVLLVVSIRLLVERA